MRDQKTFSLEITGSQLWLVTRALLMLSSTDGEDLLKQEFPELDPEALAEDLEDLLDTLERSAT